MGPHCPRVGDGPRNCIPVAFGPFHVSAPPRAAAELRLCSLSSRARRHSGSHCCRTCFHWYSGRETCPSRCARISRTGCRARDMFSPPSSCKTCSQIRCSCAPAPAHDVQGHFRSVASVGNPAAQQGSSHPCVRGLSRCSKRRLCGTWYRSRVLVPAFSCSPSLTPGRVQNLDPLAFWGVPSGPSTWGGSKWPKRIQLKMIGFAKMQS